MSADDRARWDARYAGRAEAPGQPDAALVELASVLPRQGKALDIAGGDGRNAAWLAARGLDVTIVDASPVGLARAEAFVRAQGHAVHVQCLDLEREPLPEGPWALALCVSYLQRDLWPPVALRLAPGGRLVWIHPTVRNLERNPKPSRRFLLEPGEAESIVRDLVPALRIETAVEGWSEDGRHLARIVATRP